MKEAGDVSLKEKMKLIRDTFLTHRECGVSEALYRLLPHLHLKESSIGVVFLHTGREKSRFLKKLTEEEAATTQNVVTIADSEGFYVETSNLIEKYMKRPDSLKLISLMQFAKRYTTVRAKSAFKDNDEEDQEDEEGVEDPVKSIKESIVKMEEKSKTRFEVNILLESELPDDQDNVIENDYIIHLERKNRQPLPKNIELQGSFYPGEPRQMRLRKKPLVVRLHKFRRTTESHDYFYSELELYYIFESKEQKELCKDDFDVCLKIYNDNLSKINYVRNKSMPYINHVEDKMEKAEEIVNQDNIAETLDPEATKDNAECLDEGNDDTDNFIAFDYDKIEDSYAQGADGGYKRIEVDEIETLTRRTQELDDDQLFCLDKIIDYCYKYKRALLTKSALPNPLFLKVLGSAGSGKSHLIDLISMWVEHILRRPGDSLEEPYVVKSAFSGAAACNIGGGTLHTNFSLKFGFKSVGLGDKERDRLRCALRNLRVAIIDEFSMIPTDFLYKICRRLIEVKENHGIFGGVSIILLGDPLQLKPVQAEYPWELPKDPQHLNFAFSGSLWNDFESILLRTNHRQGESLTYARILEKIRINGYDGLSEEDVKTLETRILPRNDPRLPRDAIYIFSNNYAVNQMNNKYLSSIEGPLYKVEAIVKHKTLKNYKPFVLPSTGCIRNTAFQNVLYFKVNSKVLVNYNLNTNDSIVNGAFAKIVGVKQDANGKILEIHVNFDREECGKETAKKYPHLKTKYGVPTVPILRIEREPQIGQQSSGIKSSCTVYQFPLKLAHAVTCHKVS